MAAFLAYIFYFFAATASPLQRRWLASTYETDRKGQIDFAFKVTLIVALMGLLIPLIEPLHVSGNQTTLALLTLGCGIFGAGFFITQYVAQRHVDAGITTLTSNLYTPVTIILASLFLNEGLTERQLLGTGVLLFSMFLVSKKHRIGRFSFDKYFMMMIASGILLGMLLTAERALQKETGFTAGTLFSWWAQCATLGIVAFVIKDRSQHSAKYTIITGGLRFLQSLSWVILIYVVANLSVVSAITTFKVVVVFIAAAVFLGEKENLERKILGSLIAVVGLLLMK